jgi:hypothetical protein
MSEKRKNSEEAAPQTPICPLCQHTEFEHINLSFGGHPGLWSVPKTDGFLAEFRREKQGSIRTLRCLNCYHILFFAID